MNLSLTKSPTLPDADTLLPLPESAVVTVLVMTATFFLAGTFGNVLVCLLITTRRDLRKVPHFLFANLAVIGLLSSFFVMPFMISIAAGAYMMKQSESMKILCNIRLFSSLFCSATNALILSLMAIDRQDCVFRPLRRRIHQSNVRKVLLAVWSSVLVLSVLFAIVLAKDGSQCSISDPFNLGSSSSNSSSLFSVYITVFGTGFNVAAILIIIITFLRIVKRLRSCPLPESRSLHQRYESQITKLTYKTCAIFILSWFPVIISHTAARFSDVDREKMRVVKLITLTFTNFTYVGNPFLHYKMLKTTPSNQLRIQPMSLRRIVSLDNNNVQKSQ